MITNIHKSILATALLLTSVTLVSSVYAASVKTQEVIDARQEAQIWTTYALSPFLRANDLKVSVQEGKATLTGDVAEDIDKDLAKQIALGVNGIKNVDNKITVNADYKPAKSTENERRYGQLIDDISITAVVKSKLLWSKNMDGLSTNVDTKFGEVTLNGIADNGAAKELAGRLAKNTHGVVAVHNLLTVKNEDNSGLMDSATKAVSDIGEEVSDSWITTKVKSTYIYSSNVDGADISVSTDNGLVTLSGKVGSGVERELAIELAQNIRGVKSVQSGELTF